MPLVVLEYVRGENLQERIDRFAPLARRARSWRPGCRSRGRSPTRTATAWCTATCGPANVLLTEEREVKLVDFGGGSYVAQLVGRSVRGTRAARGRSGRAAACRGRHLRARCAALSWRSPSSSPVAGLDGGRGAAAAPRRLAAPGGDDRPGAGHRPRLRGMPRCASSRPSCAAAQQAVAPAVRDAGSLPHRRRGRSPRRCRSSVRVHVPTSDEDTAAEDVRASTGATGLARRGRMPLAGSSARARRSPQPPASARARILAWSMVLVPLVGARARRRDDRGRARQRPGGRRETARRRRATAPPARRGSPERDLVRSRTATARSTRRGPRTPFDGDPETTWETEGYDRHDFNGLEGRAWASCCSSTRDRTCATSRSARSCPGWEVEVRAADEPAVDVLAGWTHGLGATAVRDGIADRGRPRWHAHAPPAAVDHAARGRHRARPTSSGPHRRGAGPRSREADASGRR